MKIRVAASLLAIAFVAVPVWADQPPAKQVPAKQPGRWAQDYTGRAADPDVRFGTLPNGLRYAIRHNETPSDGVAMRLRIGSGSMAERDEEQGLAHFLEHMAFRGSRAIADGEVVHMLERQGLRFGADTNAATGQDQTIYTFTFPRADAAALDTGFTLFREIGERLTLAAPAIEAEKGVVLSEERVRDTPGYRAVKANFGNALAGTRAVVRWPIGTVETIKGATPERLRRFYAANYRPDNATIVVVGAVDVAAVEAAIKARFADWKPAAPRDPAAAGVPVPAASAAEFTGAGVPDQLTLSWVRPVDPRAETEAFDREQLLTLVGLSVLNNRLADRAGKPGSPYVAAQAGTATALLGVASLTQVSIAGAPEKWREALDAVTGEQRQLLQGGVDAAELQRAGTQLLTMFQMLAANAPTRKSSDLADEIVRGANEDQIVTSPAQDLALARQVLATMKPEDVNAALRLAFAGSGASGGPVLFRATQGAAVTAPVLGQALAADYARTLGARAAQADVVWPYTDFGAPGTVTARSEDKALGATTVTFANGARLLVKPTAFEKDRIHVAVSLGNGRKGTPAALTHALWSADLMPLGGTGKLSISDITRWAQGSGRAITAKLSVGVGAFTLSGATRPQDLGSQMQLLAALARDPGFRPELADKLKAVAPMMAGQIGANAGAVFRREVARLSVGGDARFGMVPDDADLAATRPEDLPALLAPALSGSADVVMVGDVTVDAAIAAMQATLGAGTMAVRAPAPAVTVAMTPGRTEPFVVTHAGRADQAYYGVYWALPDFFADPKTAHVADVAAAVLSARLVDTVREKLGMTYSPQTDAHASVDLSGWDFLGVAIETPEANFAAFRAALDAQIADLAAKPVSADELDRARGPLVAARLKDFESNAFWIARLPLVQRDPRVAAPVLDEAEALKAVTAADVQTLARRWLAGKVPVTVVAKAK
ncbi:MAG: insulinase family protein [Sphingomonadales bacterium]|nr:insulinase family protein [Sphingomonadales bacterium]